jgi:hypothetical protein
MKYCALIAALFTLGCVQPRDVHAPSINYAPAATVTASEALRIAESFRLHRWKPSSSNVFHGLDASGVLVNTPDVSLDRRVAARPGWWEVDKICEGIPYQWGGFDTPLTFDRKLKAGFYAGDVYTESKRSKLYAGVSSRACGVDCSGFVSRCWKLARPYSTRELPLISHRLNSFGELQPGDIVNKHNVHVLLFERFLDKDKKYFMAYETGSPPSWKVLRHAISVKYLKNLGYLPYRYKNLVKDGQGQSADATESKPGGLKLSS